MRMAVNLVQTIKLIHTKLLHCSNIIRRGWTSREGIDLRLVLNKIINDVISLQTDKKLAEPSRNLVTALTRIRTKLDEGEYETGAKFLRKLKNTLVVGLEMMARSLQSPATYEAEIDRLRIMKVA